MKRIGLVCAAMILGCLPYAKVTAQHDSLQGLTDLHGQRGFSKPETVGSPLGGIPGGASMANYSELMQLIETTIAPDQWANQGGTATMVPFTSGVRIDTHGLIERIEDFKQDTAPKLKGVLDKPRDLASPSIRLDDLGAWQQPTDLRWISLHQLDAQLHERSESGLAANIAMELLGGLCRIDYVAFDDATGEWLLGGPAGNVAASLNGELLHAELKLPPVLLEDLLAVAPHILQGRGEFGCTIDPIKERLVAAHKMANERVSLRNLRSDPELWANEWKAKLGHQKATVIGLPADSPTGYALLIADAHMKRVGLGLEPSTDGLKNYWLESDMGSRENKGSMVRWWFALSDIRIPSDSKRHIYHFESSNVRVLSETQMLNQQGQRVVANRADMAADAFARNFTKSFDALQRKYPVYGRLRHIVDLAVAMEIIRSQMAAGVGKPFESIQLGDLQTHLPVAPTEIDSVVATRRHSDGTVSAIVSGGVSIAPSGTHARLREHPARFHALSIEASPGDRQSGEEAAREKPFWR